MLFMQLGSVMFIVLKTSAAKTCTLLIFILVVPFFMIKV